MPLNSNTFPSTDELINRGHTRRMSQIEDYFAILQRQKLYRNFSLYAEFNKPLDRYQLSAAIRSIVIKYPIVGHTIVPKKRRDHDEYYRSKKYYDSVYPKCDYIEVLETLYLSGILLNDQIEQKKLVDIIIDQFISSNYEYTAEIIELIGAISIAHHHKERPNWGLLLLPYKSEHKKTDKLVLISNHCSFDGMSCINFFEDLTAHINNMEDDYKKSDVVLDYDVDWPKISRLQRPLTEFIDYKPYNRELPAIILSDIIKKYLNYQSDNEMIDILRGDQSVQTYHNLLRLDLKQVNLIKREIKSNVHTRCTLTPFLQACFLVTLYRCDKFFKKSYREWGFDVALIKDLRSLLPIDGPIRDEVKYGCNIGAQHYSFLISSFDIRYEDKKKFWALVKYYYDTIQNYPRGFLISAGVLMIDGIAEYKNIDKIIIDDYLNKKRGGAMLSNLGYHTQNTDQKYHIKDLVFSQTPGALKFVFGLNAITTNVKGMNIDLSIVKTAISNKQEWGTFCEQFCNTIRNFTGTQPS